MPSKKTEIKCYTYAHLLKMLPFLKSYSKDYVKLYRSLEVLAKRKVTIEDSIKNKTTDVLRAKNILEYIDGKMKMHIANHHKWRQELEDMDIFLCHSKYGHIDVPVYDVVSETVIHICIDPNVEPNSLFWHRVDQEYSKRKKYWTHFGN